MPLASLAVRAVGIAATLVVLNYGLGWVWDTATGPSGEVPALGPGRISIDGSAQGGDSGGDDQTDTTGPVYGPEDPRVHIAQTSGDPWRFEYFRDLGVTRGAYWPNILLHNGDFESRYINMSDGDRVSYEPKVTDADELPLVSFYGGSTMWGEGQRDDHTIASEVARMAEADGMPIAVRNHGIRGVSSWQELLLFETDLAQGERPIVAVFYDGLNDCNTQDAAEVPGQPAQYLVDEMRVRLGAEDQDTPDWWTRDAAGIMWDRYLRHSLVHKLTGKVGDLLAAAPAGAAPVEKTPCATVYERARALIGAMGSDAGVETRFFWQPRPNKAGRGLVGAPTVDISAVLDDVEGDVYIDGGHTNELGARLVAEAMYEQLRPLIEAEYAAGG